MRSSDADPVFLTHLVCRFFKMRKKSLQLEFGVFALFRFTYKVHFFQYVRAIPGRTCNINAQTLHK